MNQNEHYSTPSLALASAIQLASKSKLQTISKQKDNKRAVFVFTPSEDLPEIVDRFWKKTLPLDAFSYFETLRYIKSRLYEI